MAFHDLNRSPITLRKGGGSPFGGDGRAGWIKKKAGRENTANPNARERKTAGYPPPTSKTRVPTPSPMNDPRYPSATPIPETRLRVSGVLTSNS